MGFLHPELLLLLLPAGFAWWYLRGAERAFSIAQLVRLTVVVAVVLALAQPYLRTAALGRDLVVVVDRSRSMPDAAHAGALELVRLAEERRAPGDRIAIVGFGARARIEQLPSEDARFAHFEGEVDADGSDLAGALETALDLVPRDRPGSVFVISDGESNGRDPLSVARRALARGIAIDVRAFEREGTSDLSVERIELPEEVATGEPFQFTVWVRSSTRVEADFALERAGEPLAHGRRVFEAGLNRVALRDVVDAAGVARYSFALTAAAGGADRVPENDRALGAVRVTGARAILVVNDDGSEDTLVRALRKARIPVAVAAPESSRFDPVALTAFRAVVLENVAASRFAGGLAALRDHVVERGGGLFVTGGRASFGTGGWFLSPVDALLPVSMELRQEHRKQAIALAITMDRSGSMAASAGPGLTKMDLANLGAVAAIELLAPIDAVGVIAVDSEPHVVQELTQVEDRSAITSRVRKIESAGGGVFSYTALLAAGRMLEGAPQKNRHVIFFADAADAEEPEDVPELLARFREAGITVSVIALGTELDSDAEFLKSVATLGGGEAYFTVDPSELPRLFAHDTLTVSRATFVEERTATRVLPDLFGLGEIPSSGFGELGGYNLTYLREGAVAGVVTEDEYQAPVFAFVQQGLGRSAAFTGEIGGTFGADLVLWPGFATFFVSVARWLVGQEEPDDVFASVRREGRDAVIAVDVDPGSGESFDASALEARVQSADGSTSRLVLERTGESRYEARYRLEKEGIALGTLRLGGDRFVELPPIALPYSPEFEHAVDAEAGARLLRRLATESGGIAGASAADLFRGERGGRAWRVISRELLIAAIALLLLEIAGRRLQLWSGVRVPASVGTTLARVGTLVRAGRARTRAKSEPEPAAVDRDERETAQGVRDAATTSATEIGTTSTIESALEKARRAAGRRLDR